MWFRRITTITVITVYLVILAGGIVRSTGAGMGCPDWPRCFGTWVPPTDVSQLPANYAEIYGAKLKGEVVFNVVKTWTEYINRLLGVLTGLFIFVTLVTSLKYWKSDRVIVWASLAAFLLVGFQGWLGSKVVSTELLPVMITLHMLLAIVIVFILLYVLARSSSSTLQVESLTNAVAVNRWLIIAMLAMLSQVLLGTQVREAIDVVAEQLGVSERANWVSHLQLPFYIHRTYSLVILAIQLYVVYLLKKNSSQRGVLSRYSTLLAGMIGVEIVSGALMAYFGIPPYIQPIHLTLSIVIIGLQFVTWLLLNWKQVSYPITN
ncbi:MAG: COX15/CtaA family protein [Spirosomataceae bacterium]